MFFPVVYQPDGYKPTYLIIDGKTLALVRNPRTPQWPLRFRLKEKCEDAVSRMNDALQYSETL